MRYKWTQHSFLKMRQYGIGPSKVLSIINNPKRKEEGIVPKTVAVMKPAGSQKHPYELWVMYQSRQSGTISKSKFPTRLPNGQVSKQIKNSQFKIISAWKYPGISPKRNPIPEEILAELKNIK